MKVPDYNNGVPSIAPNALPTPTLAAPQMSNDTVHQVSAQGAALLKIGDAMLTEANTLRTDAALNALKEEELRLTFDPQAGYKALKGNNALDRPDNKSLDEEYSESLQKRAQSLRETLGNDAQRKMFDQAAGRMVTGFRGNVIAHRNAEFQQYARDEIKSGIDLDARDMALNYGNPTALYEAAERQRARVFRLMQINGAPPQEFDTNARKVLSSSLTAATGAALDAGDLDAANAIRATFLNAFEANDLLKINSVISDKIDLRDASVAVRKLLDANRPSLQPTDMDRVMSITFDAESGGRQLNPDGTPVTSPAGAIGIGQVMPETARGIAKNLGIPFDEERYKKDSAYNAMLATGVMQEHLKRYGNLPMAWAAYNSRPATLDAAIKKAAQDTSKTWLDFMPDETQKYVKKNMEAYQKGGGVLKGMSREEMDAALQQMFAGRPRALKYTRDELATQLKLIAESKKQQEEEALNNVGAKLRANNGNLAALTADDLASIPPMKIGEVERSAKDYRDMKQNDMAWAQVLAMPDEELAKMTPPEILMKIGPFLDDAHLEKAYTLAEKARATVEKSASSDEKHLSLITNDERLKEAARRMQILPSRGKPSGKQVEQFDNFIRVAGDKILDFEKIDLQGKRKANSQELQKILDEMEMDRVFVEEWGTDPERPFFMLSTEEKEKAYVILNDGREINTAMIPEEFKAMAIKVLRSKGYIPSMKLIAERWARENPKKQENSGLDSVREFFEFKRSK